MAKALTSFCLLLFIINLYGQDEDLDKLFKVDYDTPLTIDLEAEEEAEEEVVKEPKKKVKRNFYFGLKTRKNYTRQVAGRKEVIELFNTLKSDEIPPVFLAPMGVDLSRFNRTTPYQTYSGDETIRLISCGRLNYVKAHDDLIRAVGQLKQLGKTVE